MTQKTHGPARNVAPLVPAMAAVVVLVTLTGALALAASDGIDHPAGRAALHLVLVAAPLAAGLYALRSPTFARFGRLLIVASFAWSVAVLGESSRSLPYSIGRVAAWTVFPVVIYVVLAFPEGRLSARRDRALFACVGVLVGVFYIGSTPFVDAFPVSNPWTSCGDHCPANAFFVLSYEPAFIGSVIEPLRDLAGALILVAAAASMIARLRGAGAARRLMAAPVSVAGIAGYLVLAAFLVARHGHADTAATRALGVAWVLSLPAIAAAFGVGLVQRRLLLANALSGLSRALSASLTPGEVGAALRSALGDVPVEVVVRDAGDGRWLREGGVPVDPADLPGPGRRMREISDRHRPVVALLVDEDLDSDDEITEAMASVAEAAIRVADLKEQLEVSMRDLEDSRKRIATAADSERRRIERDLHDGAQQRLVAMRMKLSLAEDLLPSESPALGAIHGLEHDVDLALEDVRSLAHGIYPALLTDRGLPEALRSAARRAPLRVVVEARGLSRHPQEVESAIYFSCLEALQNAVKHGRDATCATISLHEDGVLAFEVRDDGAGFDLLATPEGSGLRNMRDRMESLGGSVTLISEPGVGTTVCGVVPLDA